MYAKIFLIGVFLLLKVLVCELEGGNANAVDIRRLLRFLAADCIGEH